MRLAKPSAVPPGQTKREIFFFQKKQKKLNHIFHITLILIPHNFPHVGNLRQMSGDCLEVEKEPG